MQATHWKMLEVLAQEVVEHRWPYVDQAPYKSVNSGNEFLYLLIDVFATEDPRFWALGLFRCPAKGTFCYIKSGVVYYGETAAKVFLDSESSIPLSNAAFQRMLFSNHETQRAGLIWLSTVVRRMGRTDVTAQMAVVPYPRKEEQDEAAE